MPTVTREHAALLLIDVQSDFMPGGPLACHEGDAFLPALRELMQRDLFERVVATQDWHPAGHVSFASSHAGRKPFDQMPLHGQPQTLWPDHCVQGTVGAQLHQDVDWSRADLILRKGSNPQVDSYSAFRENHGPDGSRPSTGLAGWLREQQISSVWLAGLARDVCVLWSAQDAVEAGFDVHLLWDLTRPVTPDTNPQTRRQLHSSGVQVIEDSRALDA